VCGTPLPLPGAGDLVITELMYNPRNSPVEDSFEWFELHNPGSTTFSLQGCILSESTRTHTIGALTIEPGDFLTLASSAIPGFTPDYVHNRDVMLVNSSGGGMTLTCASVLVDRVIYQTSGAWPASTDGSSIALDPAHYDATDNDNGANWCLATASYGTNNNLGSPGVTNDSCACVPLTACPSPYNCGDISNGCGGTLTCGSCTLPQTCGGSGTANVCGQGACVPTSCTAEGAECGMISDGCGAQLDCGSCTAPETCGGGGADNVCGCTPTSCSAQNANCGSLADGCGNTLTCGTCTAPETCGGGGDDNVCGCTPLTACPGNLNCGTIPNGCGGTVSCGSCTAPATCGGGGTSNVCGLPQPGAGQVIFTEIMANPFTVDDATGEWFELHNPTSSAFSLRGCTLADNTGSFVINTDLDIPAGGYLALARGASPGFTPDLVYTGLALANTGDELHLTCSSLLIDEVVFGTGFPLASGVAMNLDPASSSSVANDLAANWCAATQSYNGDLGTPGAANTTCACTPLSSCPGSLNCGAYPDGCGSTISCGSCTAPQSCGGGGTPNVCGCTPLTACPGGLNCGDYADGCGGTINCGSCTSPQTCTNNVCSCTPLTACPGGLNCGDYADGCGGTINCGSCTSPQTCTNNVCSCTPLTACPGGLNCGDYADGCGGTISCGSCSSPQTCGGGGATNVCGCTPLTACPGGLNCGDYADGCGGTINCGSCTSPQTCGGGGATNVCGLPQPGVGQVIISEIMVDPTTVGDPNGEWFELHNTSTAAFNLEGCVVADNAGSFTITGALIIPSGGYLALARSASPGFTPDYIYPTISLNNTGGDSLTLTCSSTVVDAVVFGSTFPIEAGKAMNLAPDSLNATANDSASNWCIASVSYNGDLGTPGAANSTCGSAPTYTVGWCRLQAPASMISIQGDTRIVYGQVFVDGVTNLTSGPDVNTQVIGQVGFGANGSDPNTWTGWTTADVNAGFSNAANDEYMASATIPAASAEHYDYAFRFSADGGSNWRYCDLDGTAINNYTPDQAGDLLSQTSHSIDWCRLQTATINQDQGTSATAYGQLLITGLTDLDRTANNPHPIVKGQVGYGPDASMPPTSWTWVDAVPNPGWTPSNNPNDEYMATFAVPPMLGSPYDLAFRFSGDDGATWTYCDLDGTNNNGYTVDQAGAMTSTTSVTPTLFFSEYIEGSSNNKAVEIYNPTGVDVDLSNCAVRLYFGVPTPGTTIPLSGTLAAKDVYVVCDNDSTASILSVCDLPSPASFFNGDDAVELICNGATLDVIGQIGSDPGTEWGTGLTSTADNTLVRSCMVVAGDTNGADAFVPATEWTGYAVDTFTYLGSHTCP
jgi:hypothetical protein